jgi:hypothetical protein
MPTRLNIADGTAGPPFRDFAADQICSDGRPSRELIRDKRSAVVLGSALMPRLLIVHHTPSPALQDMFEAAVSGARTDEIEGVEVVIRPALTAGAADVLAADGYLLGTPVSIALVTLGGLRAGRVEGEEAAAGHPRGG